MLVYINKQSKMGGEWQFNFKPLYTDEQVKIYQDLLIRFKDNFCKLQSLVNGELGFGNEPKWGEPPYNNNIFLEFEENYGGYGYDNSVIFPWDPNQKYRSTFPHLKVNNPDTIRICLPLQQIIVGLVGAEYNINPNSDGYSELYFCGSGWIIMDGSEDMLSEYLKIMEAGPVIEIPYCTPCNNSMLNECRCSCFPQCDILLTHCDKCQMCVPKCYKHCDKCQMCVPKCYKHCPDCNQCFDNEFKLKHCDKCQRCVPKRYKHCPDCNQCFDCIFKLKHCDQCQMCVHNTHSHCDQCQKCTPNIQRHCDQCQKCVSNALTHCEQCQKCTPKASEHCSNCQKCQKVSGLKCSKCGTHIVASAGV